MLLKAITTDKSSCWYYYMPADNTVEAPAHIRKQFITFYWGRVHKQDAIRLR